MGGRGTEHHRALKPRGAKDDPKSYTDQQSKEPGSATALLAYLIALVQNRLASSRNDLAHGPDNGTKACDTIRLNLSTGREKDNSDSYPGTWSNVVGGVQRIPFTTVTRQLSKIGILTDMDNEPPPGLACQFAYPETQQKNSGKKMQYGLVVTGIRHNIETDLAQHIHQTLLAS